MANCTSQWTGQDEFTLYADCHVWKPLYLLAYSVLLVFALINFILSYIRVSQGKGLFSICLTAYSFWMSIACGIRLPTGWVLGDRNVALNMTTALALAFLSCGLSLYALRFLEILLFTENGRRKEEIIGKATRSFYLYMFVSFFLQVLTIMVPALTDISFDPALWISFNIQLSLLTVIFYYYALQVWDLLNHEISKVHLSLRRRLDHVLMIWAAIYVLGTILMALLVFVDVLISNQYIVVPLVWFSCTAIALAVLTGTRDSPPVADSGHMISSSASDLFKAPRNNFVPDSPGGSFIYSVSDSVELTDNSNTPTPLIHGRRISPYVRLTTLSATNSLVGAASFREADEDESQRKLSTDGQIHAKGMERLEEGEWIAPQERICLTIDTVDRNPRTITVIETDPLEGDNCSL